MSLIAEPKAPVLPSSPGVLIVEDEPAISELVTDALKRELHCRVRTAGSLKQAKRIMATEQIDLLIADGEKPLALAGVMGGLNSEVSAATTRIVQVAQPIEG